MRKCFAPDSVNSGRPETSAPLYCLDCTTATPFSLSYSSRNAAKYMPFFFPLPGHRQNHFHNYSCKYRRGQCVMTLSMFPSHHYRLNPSFNSIFLLYETLTAEKIRDVDIVNDDRELDFCERCIWSAYADERP